MCWDVFCVFLDAIFVYVSSLNQTSLDQTNGQSCLHLLCDPAFVKSQKSHYKHSSQTQIHTPNYLLYLTFYTKPIFSVPWITEGQVPPSDPEPTSTIQTSQSWAVPPPRPRLSCGQHGKGPGLRFPLLLPLPPTTPVLPPCGPARCDRPLVSGGTASKNELRMASTSPYHPSVLFTN